MIHSPKDNVICRMSHDVNKTIKFNKLNSIISNNLLINYMNDIKNMAYLDDKKIENIQNMNEEEKMKIIITFNNVIKSFRDVFNYRELK
jgi:hypothetical protein